MSLMAERWLPKFVIFTRLIEFVAYAWMCHVTFVWVVSFMSLIESVSFTADMRHECRWREDSLSSWHIYESLSSWDICHSLSSRDIYESQLTCDMSASGNKTHWVRDIHKSHWIREVYVSYWVGGIYMSDSWLVTWVQVEKRRIEFVTYI